MDLIPSVTTLKEKLKYQGNNSKTGKIVEYLDGRNLIAFDLFFGKSSCKANTLKLVWVVLPFPLNK